MSHASALPSLPRLSARARACLCASMLTCLSSPHSAEARPARAKTQATSPAATSQAPREVSVAEAFPTTPDFYPPDEQSLELKLAVEQAMGIYLVDPPRRHASERVDYADDHLHFHIWRPISGRSMTALWSEAASWLVFGRIKYSQGARLIFEMVPGLRQVTLSYHEVIRPGEDGRRRSDKPDQVNTYLTVSLTREAFERLDVEELRLCAQHERCGKKTRGAFSVVKLNQQYLNGAARDGR